MGTEADDVRGRPLPPSPRFVRDDALPQPPDDVEPDPELPAAPIGTRVARLEQRPPRRRWFERPVLLILAVTAMAGGIRFYHLSSPHAYVFDETYYAKDGCFDAGYPYAACKLDSPGEQTFTVHPPLGRWIIAGGEKAFGNRPFGWRFASAVAGTLSVLLLSIMAYRMFGSALWAAVAGLLLGTESMNFVQSRMSMLDIFLALFVVAGFLFLVLDREWMGRRTPVAERVRMSDEAALLDMPPDRPPSPIWRPWRVAAGIAFGAALAVKWSGGPALVGAILLVYGWEWGRRRQSGLRHAFWEAFRDESFGVFVFLVLLPVAVYLASYARWFADHGIHMGEWIRTQRAMLDYSLNLRAPHPYASRPWKWPLLIRPVAYYYKGGSNPSTSAEVLGIGSPIVFWACLIAIPYMLVAGLRRRDWRASLILVAYGSQYFAWFFAARTAFLFYMTPVTPFMVLALTYLVRDLSGLRAERPGARVASRVLAIAVVVAAVGAFAFFFPVLTGRVISYSSWRWRIWLNTWI